MSFYYVYILYSVRKKFIYIGFTTNLRKRYKQHNSGKVTSTKAFCPLEIIHYEAYLEKSDAKRREKYLKSNKGKTTLLTMLKDYFQNHKLS